MKSENGEYVLREQIGKFLELKTESIGPPEICLGERLIKADIEIDYTVWELVLFNV